MSDRSAPQTPTATRKPTHRAARLVLQLAAFALGLALFGWCASVALKPDNRAQLERLADAPWHQAALLIILSMGVVITNGLLFWVMLVPVRRLRAIDVVAVNTVCTLLAYAPFKLGLVLRIFVHNRRDGVPLLTIGAWFTAIAAVTMLTITPIVAAGLWRGRVDSLWWATAVGGTALGLTTLLIAGRFFVDGPGWRWIEAIWERLPLPRRWRSSPSDAPASTGARARPRLLERLHELLRMISHPWAVLACAGFRLVDIVLQAARFHVAASVVGKPIAWDESLLAGTTYLFIGAVAPTGQLGFREAGTAGLIGRVARDGGGPPIDFEAFTVVVLMVTGAEVVMLIVAASIAALYLRPDRLLKGLPQPPATPLLAAASPTSSN